MTEEMRNYIHEALDKIYMIDRRQDLVTTTETVTLDAADDKLVATSQSGVRYNKQALFAYMSEKNYRFTEDAVNLLAPKFAVTEGENVTMNITNQKMVEKDEMEEIKDEDMTQFLLVKLIQKLHAMEAARYEYAVEIIYDKYNGGTNKDELERVLIKAQSKGWRLKNIFTNEVGVNSSSVTIGGVTSGTNATMDQVVMIFERRVDPDNPERG